jgi:hypothetical protein
MNNIFKESIISALESAKAREHKMSLISDMEHEKVFTCEDCNMSLIIRENLIIRGQAVRFLCSTKVDEISYYTETDKKEIEKYIN